MVSDQQDEFLDRVSASVMPERLLEESWSQSTNEKKRYG